MANGDDSKNQQKTNEEIKKGNTLLSDQALIVQNLRNAFDSLGDKIRDSIEEAIDSMDDLSSSTEKLAKSNLRDVESGIKKIGRTLENNSEIQYRINQGQDQSKKIADQRAKIEARHSVTVAQIQASTLLTAKQKENLKELADKEFNKAKDLNDELKKQNINQLKGVSLYKMMGKNLEGIVNKIDESGVLAAGLRGELDATTFALRASEAGAMSFVNMMVNGIVTISKNMTALQKDFGFTADEALKLENHFRDIAVAQEGNVALQKDIQKSFVDVNSQLGLASTAIRDDILGDVGDLQKRMNLSAEATHNLAMEAQRTGASIEDIGKGSLMNLQIAGKERNLRLQMGTLFKEALEVTGLIRANLGYSIENISTAIGKVRTFGMTLNQAASISNNLLDFQTSISNELQAELFIGRELNLEKARLYALTGDYGKLAEEIVNNAGGELEFAKMNVLQKQKLATALGTSVEHMSNLVFDNANLAKLMQEAKDAGETELYNSLKRRDIQQQFNDLIGRAQEAILKMMDGGLGKFANTMVDILSHAWALKGILIFMGGMQLMGLVRTIAAIGFYMGTAARKAMVFRTMVSGLKTLAYIGIAAMIVSQLTKLFRPKKTQTIKDGFQEDGIVYSKPKGTMQVMLDKNDEMIAGTDLFKPMQGPSVSNTLEFKQLVSKMEFNNKLMQTFIDQSKTNTEKLIENDTVTVQSGWGAKTRYS